MNDVRWFAPNRFCTLVVPALRARGISIALDGDAPARVAVAMDAQVAAAAYAYAVRHHALLIHYIWDLPPWRLGEGRPDWVWYLWGHFLCVPRIGRRYPERAGYYSRLRYVATRAREVWVPTAHTAASVAERLAIACRHVAFCFDSDRFTPAPAGGSRGLLTVSRLARHKNHPGRRRGPRGGDRGRARWAEAIQRRALTSDDPRGGRAFRHRAPTVLELKGGVSRRRRRLEGLQSAAR